MGSPSGQWDRAIDGAPPGLLYCFIPVPNFDREIDAALLVLLANSTGNDLLDYVQTKEHWRLTRTPVTVAAMKAALDPARTPDIAGLIKDLAGDEEATRKAAAEKIRAMGPGVLPQLEKAAEAHKGKAGPLQALIRELAETARALAARRLMAIRTLGELKQRKALPVLRPLLKSRAVFEAEYARQAIASIEGKPFTRPEPPADVRQKLVWMLPAGCGVVGQFAMRPGEPINFRKAVKDAEKARDADAMVVRDMAFLFPACVAYAVGNLRLHSVTVGIAAEIDDERGFVVLIVQGRHDAKAVKRFLQPSADGKTQSVNGVEVVWRGGREWAVAVMVPSNDRFVVVMGPSRDALPIKPVTSAIKTGKGGLSPTGELGKLIKSVDSTQRLWAVAKVTDTYRRGCPIAAPFETVTLVVRPEKGADSLTLVARGSDAKKVAAAVAEFSRQMAKLKTQATAELAQEEPLLKPVVDCVVSIKAETHGTKATLTATLKGAAGLQLLSVEFLFRALGVRSRLGFWP